MACSGRTLAGPLLSMPKLSSTVTVVTTPAWLFARLLSGLAPETRAAFAIAPAGVVASTVATMVIVAEAPALSVPSRQVTPALHNPWLAVADTSVRPAGSASTMATSSAAAGPLLTTLSV